jgi:hypothetical protein
MAGPNAPVVSATLSASSEAPRPPRPRPATQAEAQAIPPASEPLRDPAKNEEAPRPAAAALAAIDLLARVPRPRPEAPSPKLALLEQDPTQQPDDTPIAPRVPARLSADLKACLVRLDALGVTYTRLPPIAPGKACAVPTPLEVTSLGSGVAISPAATLNCETAEALALWVKQSVVPAARRAFGAVPRAVVHDSTYVCRPRNNVAGARLSEHATANAVDIARIRFADRADVEVRAWPQNAPEGRFAKAIRQDSCAYFTTVLGPGSNAAHATHFHFDLAARRHGYRLCDLGESPQLSKR